MDFEKARFNMIEQQIRPWNVLNQAVLDLLEVVKRENFVSTGLEKLAFTDCDLPIRVDGKDTGETMFSPKMEARVLQELELNNYDKVLEIGTGTGYMAALMAQQCAQVTTIEINPAIAKMARSNLTKNGITGVKVVDGCGFELAPSLGQFDAIVLSGASPTMPKGLLEALNPLGRLMAIVGQAPAMQLVLAKKSRDSQLISTPLFETMAKVLNNAPKANEFVF
ncbi:MAG: protein-L-isoaspartate O-methyltransferase [Gammaproteobacteria bacterium]|uniref:protein-L-isoaspartate O-methyltransferase family protein n=1 Tax=Limnobacter sp. TaxID=2003368 RepID=UPI001D458510|nr:protein-L-isoaspartate O-methyltransferase [Limnobacter sp.]MBU0784689.1 protein-L-isoaspartate O-methyltransferase [Gammaproteobacteria bacterium]MBU0848074.1 protein-L-isoaspartate O-methyltransferase [Gammaproteobacteria bacterium]MBU1266365.1 protein-L-isoaspartate O-methyltransferase [Gammaproteobacteria bacterium]MBU1529974.1 protein-L-isoaspartate O-methyltransferase [Gammaproteobacteria bacterium]MBU1779889.1 protein-L-isoaspartate O-methyltransferase [Gammaproteobacteria bacterium]